MKYFSDPNNVNLMSSHLSYSYLQLDINYAKKQNCYFKKGTFLSDNGLLLQNVSVDRSFALDYLSIDFTNNLYYNKPLIITRIYLTRIEEDFIRIYIKLQDLYPVLMSIFKVIYLFFSTIANFMNNFIFANKILNELFDFRKSNKKKQVREKVFKNADYNTKNNSEIRLELNKSSIYGKDDRLINNPQIKEPRNNKIPQEKQLNNNSLNEEQKKVLCQKDDFVYFFPLWIELKSIFCKRFLSEKELKKYQIFEKGIKILKEKTNIISFLKNMDDMNEMKLIIFNKFQAMCFNFIRRPTLDDNSEKDNFSELFNSLKKDEIDQKIDIVNYFTNEAKYVDSIYDSKLKDFLNDEIKSVIDDINYFK